MEVCATLKFALSVTLCLFHLFLLTACMPSKGSSYTLYCSVPEGYFGAALRLAFPLFLYQVSADWHFFRCPFCFRRPCARNLVLIFAWTKSLLILFSGAIGKGKSLALQPRTPCPTWFPRESLMLLLKKLFSEIPVVLWPGN